MQKSNSQSEHSMCLLCKNLPQSSQWYVVHPRHNMLSHKQGTQAVSREPLFDDASSITLTLPKNCSLLVAETENALAALEDLKLSEKSMKPLLIEVERQGDEFLAKISGEVRPTLECDRCLEPFCSSFQILEKAYFVNSLDSEEDTVTQFGDHILNESESWQYPLSPNFTLNLEPFFVDALYSVVPVIQLCSQECSGLCPECGANLNLSKLCDCKHQEQ